MCRWPAARASSRACIQMCTQPAMHVPGRACSQLCTHPATCTFKPCTQKAVHAAGCARSWMCTLSALHVPSVPPSPREGRGAAGEPQASAGGQGPGYLAGVLAGLHGPHVLVQLLTELLQLPLQQHLRGQDGAVVGEAGAARTPRPSSTGTGTPRCHPLAPHLPPAAYLDRLSLRLRQRCPGLERARGRLGVHPAQRLSAPLCAGAAYLPGLLQHRGFPRFVVKNAAGLHGVIGVTPAGPVGSREELSPSSPPLCGHPTRGRATRHHLNAVLCRTHQSSPLGMPGGSASDGPFLRGSGGDGGAAVGEGPSLPVGQ